MTGTFNSNIIKHGASPHAINIYTDGSFDPKSKKGAWSVVILDHRKIRKFSGIRKETTNNRIELEAVIQALKFVTLKNVKKVNIYTDSFYVFDIVKSKKFLVWKKNNWKKKNRKKIKNFQEWKRFIKYYNLLKSKNIDVNIIKVKAHSQNYYNNLADRIAKNKLIESRYNNGN